MVIPIVVSFRTESSRSKWTWPELAILNFVRFPARICRHNVLDKTFYR